MGYLGFMRRWVWWMVVVGLCCFIACGGTSLRRGSGSDDGSPDGGTSGSAGASAETGGTPNGGSPNATGGRGGSAGGGDTSGSGGSAGSSFGGEPSGGTSGDAGAAGEPSCRPGPLFNDCSRAATCEVFECGAPWSLYDAEGCERTQCTDSGSCPSGQRCVPRPVLGKYDDPCFHGPDSCYPSLGECDCSYWEECMPLALCVPIEEFPPERDCSFVGTDCVELTTAVETLEAYRDGTAFMPIGGPYEPPAPLAASVEACAEKLATLLQAECD
jgi:hypothetical protein